MKSNRAVTDYIDRICTIEMRSSRIKQGTLLTLYEEARRLQGMSLTYLAAKRLAQTIRQGDNVIITTGIGEPKKIPYGETDGPPGAAAIARIVSLFLNANPVIVAGEDYIEPVLASCRALGLKVSETPQEKAVLREVAPLNDDDARQKGFELLDRYHPSAIVSVEALGPNRKGIFHSLGGIDLTPYNVSFHHMFDLAKEKGILTVGVGDGGNEIGCGLIYESVRKTLEYGEICKCPCNEGVATVTATDVLVLGGTSNWGAYGIEASLAIILRNSSVLHTPEEEEKSLRDCIAAGARDGPSGSSEILVDAIPLETHKALLIMLKTIITKHLE